MLSCWAEMMSCCLKDFETITLRLLDGVFLGMKAET